MNAQIARVNDVFGLNAFCAKEGPQIEEGERERLVDWDKDLISKAKASSSSSSSSSDRGESSTTSLGRLMGIPVGVKDNFCQKGERTSCSSKMLYSFKAPFSSTVVNRLEQDGALIPRLHCNMDEFAMGSGSVRSVFGPVHNPWIGKEDNDQFLRSAGGSSGGSVASVASYALHGSIGSDTGGSIRLPASWCGIVGLKPSYGRVSRHGLVAFGSSFDCPSLASRSVRDAALLLDCVSGVDPLDVNTIPEDPTNLASDPSIWNRSDLSHPSLSRPLRIGIPKVSFLFSIFSSLLFSDTLTDHLIDGDRRNTTSTSCQESIWTCGREWRRRFAPLAQRLLKSQCLTHLLPLDVITSSLGPKLLPIFRALMAFDTVFDLDLSLLFSSFSSLSVETDRVGTRNAGYKDETSTSIEESVEMARSKGFGPEVKRRILTGAFVLSRGSFLFLYLCLIVLETL